MIYGCYMVHLWLLMVMNNGYKWFNADLMGFKSGTLW
jgi:hypothetical protein